MNLEDVQDCVGDVSSRYPCPCGSAKDFDHCHKATGETLFAAIHEIGHAASLPPDSHQHVSFLNPCPHCPDEVEAKPWSLAHTSYSKEVQFSFFDQVLYTLAGGAAEVTCGCKSTSGTFGDFPASMGHDFDDFKDYLKQQKYDFEDAAPYLSGWFAIVVNHLTKNVQQVRTLALELIDKRSLTHAEVNFEFLDREQLLREILDYQPDSPVQETPELPPS